MTISAASIVRRSLNGLAARERQRSMPPRAAARTAVRRGVGGEAHPLGRRRGPAQAVDLGALRRASARRRRSARDGGDGAGRAPATTPRAGRPPHDVRRPVDAAADRGPRRSSRRAASAERALRAWARAGVALGEDPLQLADPGPLEEGRGQLGRGADLAVDDEARPTSRSPNSPSRASSSSRISSPRGFRSGSRNRSTDSSRWSRLDLGQARDRRAASRTAPRAASPRSRRSARPRARRRTPARARGRRRRSARPPRAPSRARPAGRRRSRRPATGRRSR